MDSGMPGAQGRESGNRHRGENNGEGFEEHQGSVGAVADQAIARPVPV